MGRVARYKKMKAVDPFNKKRQDSNDSESKSSKKVNLEQIAKDQTALPRSLKTMLWAKEQMKKKPERKQTQKEKKKEGIRPGENFYTFSKRLKEETFQEIRKIQVPSVSKTTEKKKQFLKEKKKKKQLKRKRKREDDSEDEPQQKELIQFGEVVQQPPTLSVVPKRKKMFSLAPDEREKQIQERNLELYRSQIIKNYKNSKKQTSI